MDGVRHLISCRCILPQFRHVANPMFHKFTVFSIVDDEDAVLQSFAQCNNCDIVHRIIDLCKSEIVKGKEQLASIPAISDIKLELPPSLSEFLENYNVDITIWQQSQFILRYCKWGEKIVVQKEETDEAIDGKYLIFDGPRKFRIENFTFTTAE